MTCHRQRAEHMPVIWLDSYEPPRKDNHPHLAPYDWLISRGHTYVANALRLGAYDITAAQRTIGADAALRYLDGVRLYERRK